MRPFFLTLVLLFSIAFCLHTTKIVLQLLNKSVQDDPEMPLAMAAYRALNEVVARSKGAIISSLIMSLCLGILTHPSYLPSFIDSSATEETTHGLILELGHATDYLVKASKNISLKSVAQIYMFFITGASRNHTVCAD